MGLRWTEEELEEYQRRQGKGTSPGADASPSPSREGFEERGRRANKAFPFGDDSLASAPGGAACKAVTDEVDNHQTFIIPSEDSEQITLFAWAARMTGKYPELRWLYHVPNGGSRGPAEAGRFKAMGVKPGVPDVRWTCPAGASTGCASR